MNSKRILLLVCVGSMLWLAGGCSTPASRICENPEVFARLTPEQQELIRTGRVALGFDQEMVRLALGEPDRVTTRRDLDGTAQVWSYVTYEGPDGAMLYRGFYHRHYLWGHPAYPYYLSVPARREREHFRVIFRDGLVQVIEQETRGL